MIWIYEYKVTNTKFEFELLEKTEILWKCRILDPYRKFNVWPHNSIHHWQADWMKKYSRPVKGPEIKGIKFTSKSGKKMETRIIKCQ